MRRAAIVIIVLYAAALTFYVAMQNVNSVLVQGHLDDCGYVPHPIPDVAWELYANKGLPIGTAGYYSIMSGSKNIKAVECLKRRLPARWSSF